MSQKTKNGEVIFYPQNTRKHLITEKHRNGSYSCVHQKILTFYYSVQLFVQVLRALTFTHKKTVLRHFSSP